MRKLVPGVPCEFDHLRLHHCTIMIKHLKTAPDPRRPNRTADSRLRAQIQSPRPFPDPNRPSIQCTLELGPKLLNGSLGPLSHCSRTEKHTVFVPKKSALAILHYKTWKQLKTSPQISNFTLGPLSQCSCIV